MTPPGAPAGGSASFSSTLRACHAATLPTAAQKCRHSGRAWCWAAVEAAMLPRSNSWLKSDYHRIAACRGKKIAAAAVGPRSSSWSSTACETAEVRCLAEAGAA